MRIPLKIMLLVLLLAITANTRAATETSIDWQSWSDKAFQKAASENRFILLDLEAVWCHWCHVMDQKTYTDPDVIKLIEKAYIPVKVDQDARPDLSKRYEIFGWPATVVFASDGTEIVKLRGYIPPGRMKSILQAIIDDPSPVDYGIPDPDTFSRDSKLSKSLREELEQRHVEQYDTEHGGFPTQQKFLIPNDVEYTLVRAANGDKQQEMRARQTLDAALNLLDPVWGGFYQYSTHGDWEHQHFEKIMSVQAGYIRSYAFAYSLFKEPRYLEAAEAVVRYVDSFLTSPAGAFYTSQDADVEKGKHSGQYFKLNDRARRSLGIPAVDKHIYARENGWMIEALALLYEVTQDERYLVRARLAARWVEANRSLSAGGFSHDKEDVAGPYLEDTLAMARAYLQLYRVTSFRLWLDKALVSAKFINDNFTQYTKAGLINAVPDNSPIKPVAKVEENIDFVRFANLLQHYSGDKNLQPAIDHAMRFLATAELHKFRLSGAGLLLADNELRRDPLHLTVVGSKGDKTAAQLFDTGLAYPGWYKRIEWWDRELGPLLNSDVRYPELDQTAAFICTDNRCSLPIFKPDKFTNKIRLINSG